jgi:hypothetical protein
MHDLPTSPNETSETRLRMGTDHLVQPHRLELLRHIVERDVPEDLPVAKIEQTELGLAQNIVVVPSVGLAAPYYGVPPSPDYGVPPASYYGLSPCYGARGTPASAGGYA